MGFQGCKVVRLSVAEPVPIEYRPMGEPDQPRGSLRDSAFWYPQPLGPHVCLNEDSFPQRKNHIENYRPLFWTLFGGPGGIYLRHLIGIAAHQSGIISGIDFKYDIEDVPTEYRTLGRHECDPSAPGCKEPMEFCIDGPGGELIDGVEVYLVVRPRYDLTWRYHKYPDTCSRNVAGKGVMASLKVRACSP